MGVVFVSGIFLLMLGKLFTSNNGISHIDEDKADKKIYIEQEEDYEKRLSRQLSQILKKIDGVVDIDVIITLENQVQIQPAFNIVNTEKTSEEKDQGGALRTVVENQSNKQIVILRKGGNEEPVVLEEVSPKVKGVLIVAQGKPSSEIVEKITKATATLLDIPLYKINVLLR